jgi:hypothetical protein
MGARRRCCCECWEFLDNFNRTPGTDLGASWHEQRGDWDIIGSADFGRLHEKYNEAGGTADAMVICTHPVPSHSAGEMSVSVWFCEPKTGDINYIYPACVDTHTWTVRREVRMHFRSESVDGNGLHKWNR